MLTSQNCVFYSISTTGNIYLFLSHIAGLLKNNLTGINKKDPNTAKDGANKSLLEWFYEMNMMKEWFVCFSTYTLYPDMDSRIAETNIGKMISLSDVNQKRGSESSQELATIFMSIVHNFNGLHVKYNGWQEMTFGLKRITESQLGGPFVWDLIMMNYIAFLNSKVFVELNGKRLMKFQYNMFPRNPSDPKTRGRFTFGEEKEPMKSFWDFEPVLPDNDEDERPYRLKTLAAMILTPRHNPYRMYRNGDENLLVCRFNIEQTQKNNKKNTANEKDPEPEPVDPDKLIEEVTKQWKEVAEQRKTRMISQLDETANAISNIFDEKGVKKSFDKIKDCKALKKRLLKRLEQNKNYMMKDFYISNPDANDEESDNENNNTDNTVDTGSEEDVGEEKSESEEDSDSDSDYGSRRKSPAKKHKTKKKENETPTRPPKRMRKNQANQKSPKRKKSKQG